VLSAGCLDSHGGTPRQPPAQPSETPTDQPGGTPTDQPTETPTDPNGQLPAGLERVDEPPYDIAVPECESPSGSTPSERDPLYLCANMPAEPSLSFTQATTRGSVLADAGLELGEGTDDQMYVTLLTESADRVADSAAGDAAALLRATDFETHAVLVVETGWGSGSVYPHIKRVEATDTGVHAVGCHSDPCVWTDDYTSRTTAVRFERPDALETGVVSLTVAADERWNVAAGEGVVTIPDEA
jgi:hypothetical protein